MKIKSTKQFMHPFKYSLKTQILLICVLTILLFGAVFSFLASTIFSRYYIDTIAYKYINNYDKIKRTTSNMYERGFILFQQKSGYIISLDENYELIEPTNYHIVLTIDSRNYLLQQYVPNLQVSSLISFDADGNVITAIKTNDHEYYFSSNIFPETGTIEKILYPENANGIYLNSYETFDFNHFKYISFIKKFGLMTYINYSNPNHIYILESIEETNIIVIIPILEANELSRSITQYLTFFFLVLLILLSLIIYYSFNQLFLSPLKEVSIVLKDMQNLNFNYSVPAFFNPELNEISSATNDLKIKMKQMLKELNDKNHEITRYSALQAKEFENSKELVSALSHEVKTPLHVMQATIQAILDGIFEGDSMKQELENILKEVDQTNELMKEILEVFKLQRKSNNLVLDNVNICDLLKNTANELAPVISKYSHQVIFNFPESIIYIKCIKKDIKRCISNIVLNACVYSPNQSQILINAKIFKGHYIFEIINTNVSLNQDDLKKIFEPFYQVDKSRTKTNHKGTGLGLYIVRQIMENHGYDYGMENTNNGVKFYFIVHKEKKKSKSQ